MCFLCPVKKAQSAARGLIARMGLALLAMAVLAVFPGRALQAASFFRVCAEPDNLPMSQKSNTGTGFEIEVARLLAKEMGKALKVIWIAQRDHSYFRQTLGKGACDAIMSVPSDFGRLTTTRSWYRTGFAFVTKTPMSTGSKKPFKNPFDDPKLQKLTIGVPAIGLGDIPPVAALTRRSLAKNLRPYSVFEPGKLVSAVRDETIDMAIVWGPFAGWYAGEGKDRLQVQLTAEKDGPTPLAFDISIGMRKGNDALKKKLDRALQKQRVAIGSILNQWRVPRSAKP